MVIQIQIRGISSTYTHEKIKTLSNSHLLNALIPLEDDCTSSLFCKFHEKNILLALQFFFSVHYIPYRLAYLLLITFPQVVAGAQGDLVADPRLLSPGNINLRQYIL